MYSLSYFNHLLRYKVYEIESYLLSQDKFGIFFDIYKSIFIDKNKKNYGSCNLLLLSL